MHFPPGDDGDEVLVPLDADDEILPRYDNDPSKSSGQSTFTSWTEPALRSDRLCWSLIGFAHNLAYELGLFGSFADATPVDSERSLRLERILYVYLSQTSGRLGLSSTFHNIAGEDDFTSLRLFLLDCEYYVFFYAFHLLQSTRFFYHPCPYTVVSETFTHILCR